MHSLHVFEILVIIPVPSNNANRAIFIQLSERKTRNIFFAVVTRDSIPDTLGCIGGRSGPTIS